MSRVWKANRVKKRWGRDWQPPCSYTHKEQSLFSTHSLNKFIGNWQQRSFVSTTENKMSPFQWKTWHHPCTGVTVIQI